MRRILAGAAGLVVVVGAACAVGGEARWEGTVTDSAGVAVVTNPNTGVWRAGQGWRVVQELSVGVADGEPEYQFGQIGSIGLGSDGTLHVMDVQAQRVRVFDARGRYLRTIGRPGNGPGEIGPGNPTLLLAGGDTILVADPANQRINVYLPDGTFSGSNRLSFADGIPMRWESRAGVIASQVRRFQFPGQQAPPDSMDTIQRRRANGTILDTLLRVPSGATISMTGGVPRFRLFSPEPWWTLRPDGGVLFGVNDEFRIRVHDSNGELERIFSMPTAREPVTESDKTLIKDALARTMQRSGNVPPQAIQMMISVMDFAPFYPAYTQFVAGPEGSVWVQRVLSPQSVPADMRESYDPQSDLGAPDWDVFDSEGRYLGLVAMPLRFNPLKFVGDHVYGVWRDDVDVQYVLKLRIERP